MKAVFFGIGALGVLSGLGEYAVAEFKSRAPEENSSMFEGWVSYACEAGEASAERSLYLKLAESETHKGTHAYQVLDASHACTHGTCGKTVFETKMRSTISTLPGENVIRAGETVVMRLSDGACKDTSCAPQECTFTVRGTKIGS